MSERQYIEVRCECGRVHAVQLCNATKNATPEAQDRRAFTQFGVTVPAFIIDQRWGPKRIAEFKEKYIKVVNEIGYPPTPDALPRLGYTTNNGVRFPSSWRTKPDGIKSNNFKYTPTTTN